MRDELRYRRRRHAAAGSGGRGTGNGILSGGILKANTLGPDGVPGTGDDVLDTSTFNTAGGGVSNVSNCSTAIEKALRGIPPRAIAFNHIT